jgi:hypothetical protein
MKYLKYFKPEADYNAFIQSEDFILPNVSYAVDANSTFYHIVKTETGDYKIFLLKKKNISGLTYNMVDLGLPSGLLWADRNVGASSPEDFGTYFAWGETSGYNVSTRYCTTAELCSYIQPLIGDAMELTPDNIDAFLSNIGVEGTDITAVGLGFSTDKCFSRDWSDYFDTTDGGSTFNKYAPDKLTVLQPEDDAATVNMGSEYRMPTKEDIDELRKNCYIAHIDLQGNESSSYSEYLKGIKFTGPNGNSILIPTSGYCCDSSIDYVYSQGYLWSSSIISHEPMYAHGITFGHRFGTEFSSSYQRTNGQTTRGVKVK